MDVDRLLEEISRLPRADLERVYGAVVERRREAAQSGVVERRSHEGGILQLEWRADKAGRKRSGPYWYFHWREGGVQRSMYVGKTDDPEAAVRAKFTEKGEGADAADSGDA